MISGINQPDGNDLEQLAAALGVENSNSLALTHYQQPLSPDMAARTEGAAEVDFEATLTFCQTPQTSDYHFIEGAGGVAAPLNSKHTTLDLMAALGAPAILVCGHYLGSLSHTLTAIETLNARNIPLRAIIISDRNQADFPLDETIVSLRQFTAIPIYPLPFVGKNDTSYLWENMVDLTKVVA